MVRFSIAQTMVQKIPKYCIFSWKFWQPIRVFSAAIRPGTCSKCSSSVPSRTRRALYNSMLGFSITESIIFGPIGGASENLKIILSAIENLSIPLDRARQVLLGTGLEHLEHVSERIAAGITRIGCENFHMKIQYLGIFGTIVWAMENLITPLNRAHRVVLGTELEQLELVPGRIAAGNTRIGC